MPINGLKLSRSHGKLFFSLYGSHELVFCLVCITCIVCTVDLTGLFSVN